jgi:hypothetical protein
LDWPYDGLPWVHYYLVDGLIYGKLENCSKLFRYFAHVLVKQNLNDFMFEGRKAFGDGLTNNFKELEL